MRNAILLIFIVLLLSGCKKNRLKVDISNIEANVEIVRLDRELFARSADELLDSIAAIKQRSGDFFDLYTYEVIGIGGIDDENFMPELYRFVTDTVYRQVADSLLLIFDDFAPYQKKFNKAFQYYQYHFPEESVPVVYTQMAGFNQSLIIDEGMIGISLDKYMGADCVYYQYLGVPAYKRRNMNPLRMVPETFYALGMVKFPFKSNKNQLIDHMIYQGKLVYFSEAMCPAYPDSLLLGFTNDQVRWCKANEALMWAYLAQHKLLYDSERLNLRKFIDDAPNTAVFSTNSPGRAAVWIGWQIVRSYMNNNPQVTLKQLFDTRDGQAILAASGYFPE